MNVHSEKVPSAPRRPSGEASGSYRYTRLSSTSSLSIARKVESHIGSRGSTKPTIGMRSNEESRTRSP